MSGWVPWWRAWAARKLDPWAHRNAQRYLFLQQELQLAHRWLGEFEEIDETLKWLMCRDIDHWRALGRPAINPYPPDIDGFRRYLRERYVNKAVEQIRRDKAASSEAMRRAESGVGEPQAAGVAPEAVREPTRQVPAPSDICNRPQEFLQTPRSQDSSGDVAQG